MSRAIPRLLVALIALCLAVPAAAQGRGDRNKITRQDIDEAGATVTTAEDAVRSMRPQWLQPVRGRAAVSNVDPFTAGNGRIATEAVVYIDEQRQPSLETLRNVRAADLIELKYLDQNRGVQMYGPGHEMGVILVTTVLKKKK